jgi:hypothetical protein
MNRTEMKARLEAVEAEIARYHLTDQPAALDMEKYKVLFAEAKKLRAALGYPSGRPLTDADKKARARADAQAQ